MIVIDTNALIRFFVNDDHSKAEKVRVMLETEDQVTIPDVVFPEIEYVMMKVYGLSRNHVVEAYQYISQLPKFKYSKKVSKALSLFKNTSLDMADCIVATHSYDQILASFDQKLLKVENIKSYW